MNFSNRRRNRSQVIWIILILTVFACQLPDQIAENISSSDEKLPTVSATLLEYSTPKESAAAVSTPYPEQPTSTVLVEPYPSVETDENIQLTQVGLPTALSSPQVGDLPYPGSALGDYPTAELAWGNAGTLTPPADSAYPSAENTRISESSLEMYPNQGQASSTAKPAVDTPSALYPQPTFGFTINSPTFLPAVPPTIAITPTPNWSEIPATLTPTATQTPFLTPTPTLTFTPTSTRTPLPAPPWLNVHIRASDPAAVVLSAGKPQLILFFAYWSGPSLAMAPIVAGLEKEYGSRIGFVYLDIDNPRTQAIKKTLGYDREPQFFLLDGNGKVKSEWIGYATLEELRQKIDAVLP